MIKQYKAAPPMLIEKRSNNVGTRGGAGKVCANGECKNHAMKRGLCDICYGRALKYFKKGGFEDMNTPLLQRLACITDAGYKKARAMGAK